MSNYTTKLEAYGPKSLHTCPDCGKQKVFVRYIVNASGDYIADHVGRCNRELKCGYHFTPKQYFEDHKSPIDVVKQPYRPRHLPRIEPVRPVELIPFEMLEPTLSSYDDNHFFTFLKSLFSFEVALYLVQTYYIGTSRRWPGANIFWQVDVKADLRQAKVMLYNPTTGRRVKDNGDKIYFAGKKLLKNQEANLQQSFFGEVLLTVYPHRRVAIVESEKTAVIASVYFPNILWLATGGSNGCKWTTSDVCKVLAGREVILFPDLGFYDKWTAKADLVRQQIDCKIVVSDLLERNATEEQKKSGLDLADYLLMNRAKSGCALTADEYPVSWEFDGFDKLKPQPQYASA